MSTQIKKHAQHPGRPTVVPSQWLAAPPNLQGVAILLTPKAEISFACFELFISGNLLQKCLGR